MRERTITSINIKSIRKDWRNKIKNLLQTMILFKKTTNLSSELMF